MNSDFNLLSLLHMNIQCTLKACLPIYNIALLMVLTSNNASEFYFHVMLLGFPCVNQETEWRMGVWFLPWMLREHNHNTWVMGLLWLKGDYCGCSGWNPSGVSNFAVLIILLIVFRCISLSDFNLKVRCVISAKTVFKKF